MRGGSVLARILDMIRGLMIILAAWAALALAAPVQAAASPSDKASMTATLAGRMDSRTDCGAAVGCSMGVRCFVGLVPPSFEPQGPVAGPAIPTSFEPSWRRPGWSSGSDPPVPRAQ